MNSRGPDHASLATRAEDRAGINRRPRTFHRPIAIDAAARVRGVAAARRYLGMCPWPDEDAAKVMRRLDMLGFLCLRIMNATSNYGVY